MARVQHPAHARAPVVAPGPRVVHVMTRYLRGGSERRLHDMIDSLPHATHDLIVGAESLVERAEREVTLSSVTVVPSLVRSPSPTQDPRALAAIWRLVRAARPDVVVTHQSKAGVLGRIAAARLEVPTAVSLSMANFGPGYAPAAGRVFRSFERALHRSTAAYAVVGHDLAERFEAIGVPPERLHVIRSGMRLPEEPPPARAALRARLGVPRARRLLAYVGSLEPRKNVLDLVPLLHAVGDDGTSRPFLAIAGEGPLGPELERRIGAAGLASDAALLGFLDDPLALIAAADVVVLLSQAEGVPQVLVQAAAFDTPFVAYDVDGVRELRALGARGRVARLGDRRAAVQAIREVLAWPPGDGHPSIDLSEWSPRAIRAGYRDLFAAVLDPAIVP
jgi:glycosyltransferase involved in cell wall biosynthesis